MKLALTIAALLITGSAYADDAPCYLRDDKGGYVLDDKGQRLMCAASLTVLKTRPGTLEPQRAGEPSVTEGRAVKTVRWEMVSRPTPIPKPRPGSAPGPARYHLRWLEPGHSAGVLTP